jgi:hypothetical protein
MDLDVAKLAALGVPSNHDPRSTKKKDKWESF